MQQSEERELPRGEHAVAKGPAEQPVLFSIIKYPRCQSLHCFKTPNLYVRETARAAVKLRVKLRVKLCVKPCVKLRVSPCVKLRVRLCVKL